MDRYEITEGHHTRIIPFPNFGAIGHLTPTRIVANRCRLSSINHCQFGE